MRAANAFAGFSLEEIGVVRPPGGGLGALPQRIALGDAAEIGEAGERGDVGIVHENRIAEAVDLIGPDLAPIAQPHPAMLEQRLLDLGGERGGVLRQGCVAARPLRHHRQLAQSADREQVGGDEVRIEAGIVRGAEAAMDQPDGTRRIAIAVERLGFGIAIGFAQEAVRAGSVLALLFRKVAMLSRAAAAQRASKGAGSRVVCQ